MDTGRRKRRSTDIVYMDTPDSDALGASQEAHEPVSSGEEYNVDEDEDIEEEAEDLSSKIVHDKYKKAAKAVKLAPKKVIALCKPDAELAAICASGDEAMTEELSKMFKGQKHIKKGIAFPTCISINNKVCHGSPLSLDNTVLKADDVIKIDMAVHIDGYTACMAHTLVITDNLITGILGDVFGAADFARERVMCLAVPGSKIADMYKGIEESFALRFENCKVLHILCQQAERFKVVGYEPLLNEPCANDHFEKNKIYVCDIYTSSLEGKLEKFDDEPANIYKLVPEDEIELTEVPMSYWIIDKKFQQMCFSTRALQAVSIPDIESLRSTGVLQPFPVLFVEKGVNVVHIKFTMFLTDGDSENVTFYGLQKSITDKSKLPPKKKVCKDGRKALTYCGKLPIGPSDLDIVPMINDISWNCHQKTTKEILLLACTGTFGTVAFRRILTKDDIAENMEEKWTKVQLSTDVGKFCKWCPAEGNILAVGIINQFNQGVVKLIDSNNNNSQEVFQVEGGSGLNSLSWNKTGPPAYYIR